MARPSGGYILPISGEKVPSVTEVIGRFKDSSALIGWAAKMGREGKSHTAEAAAAAIVGHDVHEAIDEYLWGRAGTTALAPNTAAVFATWQRWFSSNALLVCETEVSMVSSQLRVGGTLDAIMTGDDGEKIVADWKTSGGMYPDYVVQLAAYRHMYHELFPDAPKITKGLVVRIDKNAPTVQEWWLTAEELDRAVYLFALYREAWDVARELQARTPKRGADTLEY